MYVASCHRRRSGSVAWSRRRPIRGFSQPVVSEAVAELGDSTSASRLLRPRPAPASTLRFYRKALLVTLRSPSADYGKQIGDIEFLADPAAGEVRISCPQTLAAGVCLRL